MSSRSMLVKLLAAFAVLMAVLLVALPSLRDACATETPPGSSVRPADKWWNKSWPYRRRIIVKTDGRVRKEAYVSFPTNGRCQSDGRDIVVIAGDAQEVPSKVIACGWDDSAVVAFELRKGDSRYHVYFGNRRARKTVRNWEPEGGLLLEVRAMGEGTADTLDEMFDLINRSPRVLGRDFRTRPALTVNPFGPQEKYISSFHGILRIPETGEYTFAVNSRDASFALVNGNLVASWPGRHDADGWDAMNHSGKIFLNKGHHRLSFFNAAFGQGGCVLGISVPSREGVRPVQGGLLLPILEGSPMGLETLIQKPEPDFICRFEDDLSLEGFDASKWSFRNTTPYLKRKIHSCRWDFGDGQSGIGSEVEHLFLEGGQYTVTMTLDLGEGQVLKTAREFRLRPRGLLARQGKDRSRQYLEDLVACIEQYDLHVLSPSACSTLATLARYTNREALELDALSAMFRKDPSLDDPVRAAEALEFGQRLVRERSDFEEGVRILNRVAQKATDARIRQNGRLAAAEVYLFYMDETQNAEALLVSLKGKANTPAGRMIALRLADVSLARGLTAEAKAQYAKLAAGPSRKRRKNDEALRHGDFYTTFMSCIQSRDLDTAEKILRRWEIEMPALKGNGEITYAWAKLMMERGQWRPALKQLEWTLGLSPDGNRTPSVLLDLGNCFERMGKNAEARAFYQRIINEHPLSPEYEEAKQKLKS